MIEMNKLNISTFSPNCNVTSCMKINGQYTTVLSCSEFTDKIRVKKVDDVLSFESRYFDIIYKNSWTVTKKPILEGISVNHNVMKQYNHFVKSISRLKDIIPDGFDEEFGIIYFIITYSSKSPYDESNTKNTYKTTLYYLNEYRRWNDTMAFILKNNIHQIELEWKN